VRSVLPGLGENEGCSHLRRWEPVVQYLALMGGPGIAGPAFRRQRVIYVLEGEVTARVDREADRVLSVGGFRIPSPGH